MSPQLPISPGSHRNKQTTAPNWTGSSILRNVEVLDHVLDLAKTACVRIEMIVSRTRESYLGSINGGVPQDRYETDDKALEQSESLVHDIDLELQLNMSDAVLQPLEILASHVGLCYGLGCISSNMLEAHVGYRRRSSQEVQGIKRVGCSCSSKGH